MNLSNSLALLKEIPAYCQLVEAVSDSPARLPAGPLGLLSAARPTLLAALHAHTGRPLLVIAARADRARDLADQIRAWSAHPSAVRRLPDPDALPYERVAWGRDTIRERVSALASLAGWRGAINEQETSPGSGDAPPPLVVASTRALMQKTLPPDKFRSGLSALRVGQRIVLEDLLGGWLRTGYRAGSVVEEPGYFSRRGGIVDIFPPNQPLPVRIELFGDEIESLRTFDPLTQRSENLITAFEMAPAHEALTHQAPSAAEGVRQIDFSACHPAAQISLEEDLVRLGNAETFRGIEFYLPFFYPQPASPLDYLPADGLLVIEDPAELMAVIADLEQQAVELEKDLQRQGELPAGWPRPYFSQEELAADVRRRPHLALGHMGWPDQPMVPSGQPAELPAGHEPSSAQEGRGFTPAPVYGGQVRRLMDDLVERRRRGERVVLVSRQAARLADLLAERDIPHLQGTTAAAEEEAAEILSGESSEEDKQPPPPGSITVVRGSLGAGWILDAHNGRDAGVTPRPPPICVLLTDAEIFCYHKP